MAVSKAVGLAAVGGLLVGAVAAGVAVRAVDAARIAELNENLVAARREGEGKLRDAEARLAEAQAAVQAQRGDKTAFAAAIAAELERSGRLCIEAANWPVELAPRGFDMGERGRMTSLERAGLVRAVAVETEQRDWGGRTSKVPVTRYELTDEGRRYARPVETIFGRPGAEGLCYGRRVLEEVENWEGPITMGGYAEARVLYRYRVEVTAPWVGDDGLRQTYPDIAKQLAPEAERREMIGLKRTANGWSARGLGG